MPCIQPMLCRSKRGYIVKVPCGRCYGCLRRKQRELALRLSYDLNNSFDSLFATFTYDDDNLLYNSVSRETGEIFPLPSVSKEHAQKLLKRIRKHLDYDSKKTKLLYYLTGEYGDTTKRPHMHAIIYLIGENTCKMSLKNACIKSWNYCDWNIASIEKCLQSVQSDGAKMYVAKHQMKKCKGVDGQAPYFQLRSKGIGFTFLDNPSEIDFAERNGYLVYDRNKKAPIPRYYREKLGLQVKDGEIINSYNEQIRKENIEFNKAYTYYKQSHPSISEQEFAHKYYKKLCKDINYSEFYNEIMYNKFKNITI